MEKKLYRNERQKSIGGVCAGLAEYFDVDVAIVRLLFVLTFFAGGSSLLAYIVLWIVIPKKEINFFNPEVDYRVPPKDAFGNVPPQSGSSGTYDNVPPAQPFPFEMPPKKKSNAGLIIGVILIFMGASFLLHELHVFSFFHYTRFWPAILIFVGFALMVSGQKKQPWENPDWHEPAAPAEAANDDTVKKEADFTQDDNSSNTPPTV